MTIDSAQPYFEADLYIRSYSPGTDGRRNQDEIFRVSLRGSSPAAVVWAVRGQINAFLGIRQGEPIPDWERELLEGQS